MHLGGRLAGDTGPFRQTLAVTGWGFLPNLLGTVGFAVATLAVVGS